MSEYSSPLHIRSARTPVQGRFRRDGWCSERAYQCTIALSYIVLTGCQHDCHLTRDRMAGGRQTSVVAAVAAEGPWGLGWTEAATEAETAGAVFARRDGS